MKDIHAKIIDKINAQIGSDIANLHKSKQLIATFQQECSDIEAKVNISFIANIKKKQYFTCISSKKQISISNTVVNSSLKTSLINAATTSKVVDIKTEQINIFEEKISKNLVQYQSHLEGVSESLEKIRNLQHLVEYFLVLRDIIEIR